MGTLAYVILYFLVLAAAASLTPLWLDELHQLVGTHRATLSETIRWAQISPGGTPLNFLIQKIILDVAGLSTLAARLPAVIFGAGSLWIFGKIARDYVEDCTLTAVAIFALLPQIFRYGWEARPYSQGMFFALLAFWFWLRLERLGERRDAIGFGLAVAGGLYSQVFSAFVPVAAALWSLGNPKSRVLVWSAFLAGCAAYAPWFLTQHASAEAAQTMRGFSFTWGQITPHGFVRELSGGGYFCSIPLLIAAFPGWDKRLAWIAGLALALPVAADAALGYFFAGRQLIFALPFLTLMAAKGLGRYPRTLSAALLAILLATSGGIDIREAMRVKEDWAAPARYLAKKNACVLLRPADLMRYFHVYEPELQACDTENLPDDFYAVTTRYSERDTVPPGFHATKSNEIGVAAIVHYKRR